MRSCCLLAGMLAWLISGTPGLAEELVVEQVLISVIHSTSVPAQDVGVLTQLLVREGDQVDEGSPLIQLDREEAELNLKRIQREFEMARLEQENTTRRAFAEKSSEVAAAELKRALEANKKYPETISLTELDRLRLISERARLDSEQAEHEHRILGMQADLKRLEMDQAAYLLKRRTIKAPAGGTILKIEQRVGEWVQPGMALLSIIDTSELRAEAVLTREHRQLPLLGANVRVEVPGIGSENKGDVEGKISLIHPEIDPVDGSFRVWVNLDNREQKLRPGDSVVMRIMVESR